MDELAPGIVFRPARGNRFVFDVNPIRLKSVALFTAKANSIQVQLPPSHDFFGVTLPLAHGFVVREHGTAISYDRGRAHLLHYDERFDLRTPEGCDVLVGNFFIDPLQVYSRRLLQSDTVGLRDLEPHKSLQAPDGMALRRQLFRTWVACRNRNENAPGSTIARIELEDELVTRFVLAMCTNGYPRAPQGRQVPSYLHLAEEFLLANLKAAVTRDRLAEEASVCIRTLTRAFNKFHGMGPMAFLKQRRMDAAFVDLLAVGSELATVTDIAHGYGFAHLGKFAIEYQNLFGELPSSTLKHRAR